MGDARRLTKEECAELFQLLRPIDVMLSSRGAGQLEALLESDGLVASLILSITAYCRKESVYTWGR